MPIRKPDLPAILAVIMLGGAIATSMAGSKKEHAAPAATGAPASAERAATELKTAGGKKVGSATFEEMEGGVLMTADFYSLPPGKHGIHIHEKGKCDKPDFKSAGEHFRPGGKKHGLQSPQGAHEGDMPNLSIAANGNGRLTYELKGVTLKSGEKNSLLKSDGTALIIHAKPDDEKTDPSGNSGDRIACGVIK